MGFQNLPAESSSTRSVSPSSKSQPRKKRPRTANGLNKKYNEGADQWVFEDDEELRSINGDFADDFTGLKGKGKKAKRVDGRPIKSLFVLAL